MAKDNFLDSLQNIIENQEALKKHNAQIGVYGGTTKEKEEDKEGDLVAVAIAHEFGTSTMPQRSFLRWSLELHDQDIQKKYKRLLSKYLDKKDGWQKILLGVREEAKKIVDGGFDTGGYGLWPSLSIQTTTRKGTTAILIESGNLRRKVITKTAKN